MPGPGRATIGDRPLRALAPDVTVTERDGKPLRLSSLRGKVVVLDFWSPFGKEPEASVAVAGAAVRKWSGRGVVGIAVYTGSQDAEFSQWLAKHPDLPALHFARDTSDRRASPSGAVQERYAVYTWPLRFVIGTDGTLRERFEGDATRDPALLEKAIAAALADTPAR